MGIAHGNASDREGPLDDEEGIVEDAVEALPVVEGDVLRGQTRHAEADPDLEQEAARGQDLGRALTGGRAEEDLRRLDGAAPGQKGRRAAQAVARDLRFAAVGVEDPEADLGGLGLLDAQENEPVRSDPRVPLADPPGQVAGRRRGGPRAGGGEQEVVAEPVDLAEPHQRTLTVAMKSCDLAVGLLADEEDDLVAAGRLLEDVVEVADRSHLLAVDLEDDHAGGQVLAVGLAALADLGDQQALGRPESVAAGRRGRQGDDRDADVLFGAGDLTLLALGFELVDDGGRPSSPCRRG